MTAAARPAERVPAARPAATRALSLRGGSKGDAIFRKACGSVAASVVGLLAILVYELVRGSGAALSRFGLRFVVDRIWDPVAERFGAATFAYGTVVTSLVALLLATPLGIGIAIFLVEIAPRKLGAAVGFLVELLAAIPSIVYGLWGLFVLAPIVRDHVAPALHRTLGFLPFFRGESHGVGMLTAGVILAIMILPFIAAVSRDVLASVPDTQREASLALGATKWETIRHVVLPYGRAGIAGSVVLALGRALGETMAVTMVIGNSPQIAASLFEPAYTMSSVIANEYAEASGATYLSALTEIGLLLFVVTFAANGVARLLIWRVGRKSVGRAKSRAGVADDMRQRETRGRAADGHSPESNRGNLLAAVARCNEPLAISARRKVTGRVMLGLCVVAATLAVGVLACIFGYVLVEGARFVSLSFFTQLPAPVGESGGGFLNSLVGTGIMVGLASAMSIPVGVLSGIYLAEFGRGWLARTVRFVNDSLNATPSIVAGLFAYTLIVLETKRFSAFAGSVALAVLMIPTITRTTEEMLRLVPRTLREAALALGVPEWRMTLQIVLRAATPGVVTGIMLAVARVSGETAALLFTAFNNRFLSTSLAEPMSSVPVQVYTYAVAPYDDWHHQAWAGALVLVTLVALFSAAVRLVTRSKHRALL